MPLTGAMPARASTVRAISMLLPGDSVLAPICEAAGSDQIPLEAFRQARTGHPTRCG
jgi:hypothetical protein